MLFTFGLIPSDSVWGSKDACSKGACDSSETSKNRKAAPGSWLREPLYSYVLYKKHLNLISYLAILHSGAPGVDAICNNDVDAICNNDVIKCSFSMHHVSKFDM